jgi:DNA-binding response OmpR family regulator
MTKTKILIVDDELKFLKALETLLKRENYEVVSANNGELALKKAKEEKPSLIILDIRMPGMDGKAVLRKLREEDGTMFTPVIMLTAVQDKEAITDTIIEGGAVDYITKPFEDKELIKRVKNVLGKK